MIKKTTDTFLIKQKINKLTADLIKLRAELNWWERQKGLAMQQKIMGGANDDAQREI